MIVTDEMVERAYAVVRQPRNVTREDVRRVLEAALRKEPPTLFFPGDCIVTPKWLKVHGSAGGPCIVIPAFDEPLPPGSVRVWMPGIERAEILSYGFLITEEARLASDEEREAFRRVRFFNESGPAKNPIPISTGRRSRTRILPDL